MQMGTEGSLQVGEKQGGGTGKSRPFAASQTWMLVTLAYLVAV